MEESMDVVMDKRFCVASFQLFCLLCKFFAKYRLILEQTMPQLAIHQAPGNGPSKLTEDDDNWDRKDPADFLGQHGRANQHLNDLSPRLVEESRTLAHVLCICAHQGDGFSVVVVAGYVVQRLAVDETNHRATDHYLEAVQALLVYCF